MKENPDQKIFFSGNYYVKFWHFSGKYHKNSGILIIVRAKII